ncbi:MAG TPA: MBL fold metallo-hydrolase [Thermoanaerobaculia bacterium]|nr:MBL fold metallo-hydrolase [Thermoanaerobaculia bacterium]
MLVLAALVLVAKGVFLIPGHFSPGSQPDGNTIVLRGNDGLVVVDTGRHPEHTNEIIAFARKQKLPVTAIVNTHWHLDHTGGNALLRREYPNVHVYASDAINDALHGFLADYRKQLTDRAEIALIDSLVPPDEVITSSGTRTLAGRKLELHLESNAVTAGDLWLFDPSTKTLIAGDLVTLPAPFLDTACPTHWRAALDELSKVNFSQLIPGHGAPMKRKEFDLYRTAFNHLLDCAASSQSKETCIDGWLKDAAPLIKGEDMKYLRAMVDYYMTTSLRADAAHNAKLCGG